MKVTVTVKWRGFVRVRERGNENINKIVSERSNLLS